VKSFWLDWFIKGRKIIQNASLVSKAAVNFFMMFIHEVFDIHGFVTEG